jgi:hypothetical protein
MKKENNAMETVNLEQAQVSYNQGLAHLKSKQFKIQNY